MMKPKLAECRAHVTTIRDLEQDLRELRYPHTLRMASSARQRPFSGKRKPHQDHQCRKTVQACKSPFLLTFFPPLLQPLCSFEISSEMQGDILQCFRSCIAPMATWNLALSFLRASRHQGKPACVCLCQHITKHVVSILSSGTNTCSGRNTAVPAGAQGHKQRQYFLLWD